MFVFPLLIAGVLFEKVAVPTARGVREIWGGPVVVPARERILAFREARRRLPRRAAFRGKRGAGAVLSKESAPPRRNKYSFILNDHTSSRLLDDSIENLHPSRVPSTLTKTL